MTLCIQFDRQGSVINFISFGHLDNYSALFVEVTEHTVSCKFSF